MPPFKNFSLFKNGSRVSASKAEAPAVIEAERLKLGQIRNTVFSIGPRSNVKVAALFFKYVVPISFGRFENDRLFPPFIRDQEFIHGNDNMMHHLVMSGVLAAMHSAGYTDIIKEDDNDFVGMDGMGHPIYGSGYVAKEGCEDAIGFALLEMLEKDVKIPSLGVSVEGAFLDTSKIVSIRDVIFDHNFQSARAPVYGCDLLGRTDEKVNAVLVTLTNVPWVDLTNTPWEQVFEFRSDEESIKHFRNFRLFLSETYADKPPEFIEDDFLKRMEEFELARKKHGFDLQNSTLKTVINSKYLIGGGLSGLMAWTFGATQSSDVIGSAALIAGVSIEMATTLLNVRAANFELNHHIEGHELAYAIRARDELGGGL